MGAPLALRNARCLPWRVPKVSDDHRAMRRQAIADGAIRAFRRKGFHAASMADIIAESGLSAGAIYGHFASKDELIASVARDILDARIEGIGSVGDADELPSPPALAATFLRDVLARVGDPGLVMQVWGEAVANDTLGALARGLVDRLLAAFTDYAERWSVQRGDSPEEAAGLAGDRARIVLGLCQGGIAQAALAPDLALEPYLEAMARVRID